MLKFFRDRGGPNSPHGGYLQWPGTVDGFPVRSNSPLAPDLKQSEFDELPLSFTYKSEKFELWRPEQKAHFDEIMDRIVNGWYLKYNRNDTTSTEGVTVWLEWVQIYGEDITGKTPGAIVHAKPVTLTPAVPAIPQPTRPAPISSVSHALLGWPDDGQTGP
jgi:hypothetical protein